MDLEKESFEISDESIKKSPRYIVHDRVILLDFQVRNSLLFSEKGRIVKSVVWSKWSNMISKNSNEYESRIFFSVISRKVSGEK